MPQVQGIRKVTGIHALVVGHVAKPRVAPPDIPPIITPAAPRVGKCHITRKSRGMGIEETCYDDGQESPTLQDVSYGMRYLLQLNSENSNSRSDRDLPETRCCHEVGGCWISLGVIDRPDEGRNDGQRDTYLQVSLDACSVPYQSYSACGGSPATTDRPTEPATIYRIAPQLPTSRSAGWDLQPLLH